MTLGGAHVDGAGGARVAQPAGALGVEPGEQDAGAAVLVQLDGGGVLGDALAVADAGVRIDLDDDGIHASSSEVRLRAARAPRAAGWERSRARRTPGGRRRRGRPA